MNEEVAALVARIEALEREVAALKDRLGRSAFVVPRAVEDLTASSVTRGRLWLNEGAVGAADTVKVVLKAADESYSVKTVVTG